MFQAGRRRRERQKLDRAQAPWVARIVGTMNDDI